MTHPEPYEALSAGEKQQIYAALDAAYFSENRHEQRILRRFAKLASHTSCFVDVGASLGQYTREASLAMRRGRIVAVEADPVRFERLKENCAVWSRETGVQITAIHAAVTSKNGPVRFFVTGSDVSGGLARHGLEHLNNVTRSRVKWQEITVNGMTLESLLQDDVPDLVKVDIEGGELGLFTGCPALLARRRTQFLVELHPFDLGDGMDVPRATRAILKRAGYLERPYRGHALFVPDTVSNRLLRLADLMKGTLGLLKHKLLLTCGLRKPR